MNKVDLVEVKKDLLKVAKEFGKLPGYESFFYDFWLQRLWHGRSYSVLDGAGLAIVIMGVSGSGKSTIGALLARNVCCDFLDADDFHSVENKEKMRNGVPLTDEDRFPWLETISKALTEEISGGKTVVLCCSALQFRYREILRKADPNNGSDSVKFFCLMAPIEVIEGRMKQRESDGNHFMPAALLQSQIDLLEIHEDEGIHVLDATLSPDAIVARIQASLS